MPAGIIQLPNFPLLRYACASELCYTGHVRIVFISQPQSTPLLLKLAVAGARSGPVVALP